MPEDYKKEIEQVKKHIDSYQTGFLEGKMGYKFRTAAFLEIIFLYKNSVDVANPDLLGPNNRNTFINEVRGPIRKIKEQIRLDLKDINFLIHGASSLGRFVTKAGNRKMLKENQFSTDLDLVVDDSADFGSGFLKVWDDASGKKKLKCVDPFKIIFNQYNFKGGPKIEKLKESYRWIIENEKYDVVARARLASIIPAEKLDEELVFFQYVKDLDKKTQEILIVDIQNEIVLFRYKGKKIISYYKFDYEKRSGFTDALGVGCYESVFNQIVQNKVNRERLDLVLEIAAKLPFQKKMDNKRDSYVGKEVVKLKTSGIIGYKENPIEVMDTGGIKQANMINAELAAMTNRIAQDLGVNDALQGNTLPSGTSGALGNLLTENASSVLKEVQKAYAEFISTIYDDNLTEYLLSMFDKKTDLKKYLDPNDIRMIETHVINYFVALKEVDASINGEEFDVAIATEEVKQEMKNQPIISGALLESLRKDVQGIEVFISGEKTSKLQTVAFIREMRTTYAQNPDLFKSPFFVGLLKKEAEMEAGISGVEIDNLLKELS
jgi:hypothetical protein